MTVHHEIKCIGHRPELAGKDAVPAGPIFQIADVDGRGIATPTGQSSFAEAAVHNGSAV